MRNQHTSQSPLSIADKAAQLIMIDIHGPELSETDREHLNSHAWNGVILFAKNVVDRTQTVGLVDSIRECLPHGCLMAVDQEGGLVDRFRFPEMSLSPGLMALAATDREQACFEAHKITGRELASLGIDLDFAPCVDINNNPANPIIGVRSLGEDANQVAKLGTLAIRGLQAGGVAATAKHFPGHGNTTTDSHIALPTVTSARESLEATELKPFVEAVQSGVAAIMTAHITFPALDPTPGLPATLSKPILTGLLREKLGFEGVIVTDSLGMRAIADHFGYAEATVRSIEAGADLVLALGTYDKQLEALNGLVEAVKQGRLSESRLDESIARIAKLAETFGNETKLQPDWELSAHQEDMRKITQQSITIVRNSRELLPLRPTGSIVVVTPDLLPQSPLGENSLALSLTPFLAKLHSDTSEMRFNMSMSGPAIPELASRACKADYVILCLYARGQLSDSQVMLTKRILEQAPNTIVVPLSSPYFLSDFPEIDTCITGFNYGALSLEALAQAIMGIIPANGIMPVTLP